MRLRFWLLVMDFCAWLNRVTGSLYLWSVARASDAEDWEDDA